MDPNQFSNPSQLEYSYKTAWALAKAASEILDWVEEAEAMAKMLTKKQHGDIQNKYAIGQTYKKNASTKN